MAKKDTTIGGKFPAADFRTYYIENFPGGAPALAAALPKGLAAATRPPRPSAPAVAAGPKSPAIGGTQGDLFLVAYQSPVLGDGRGANKPWLQELPDPVTKITWSTWVELHTETAQRLGIDRGDILEVKTANGTIRAPAFPSYGNSQGRDRHPTGQGHRATASIPKFEPKSHDPSRVQWGYGRYARDLGANVGDLLPVDTDAAGALVLTSTKASVSKTGDQITLPSTEGSARQHGRGIARAVNAADINKPPTGETKRFPETRATSSCPGCGRRSRPTRRVISARRPRPITARTRASTIPTIRSA